MPREIGTLGYWWVKIGTPQPLMVEIAEHPSREDEKVVYIMGHLRMYHYVAFMEDNGNPENWEAVQEPKYATGT